MLSEPRPGQILADKYQIEQVIGRGGMGVVVAARHLHLEERVAIKFLLPEAAKSPEVVGRFVREARAAVRIKSEHVARVSDVGLLEGGEPYMVMEYLEGRDLAAWLSQSQRLPVEQAAEFLLQASEAIAEAHAAGIVHRDLKPANLFVVRRADGLDSVKVLDFGISKVNVGSTGSDASLTRTSAVMGSPLYMPPEQMAASRNVDARADIWALGVILYELTTGSAPFRGETLPEVCMKIATEQPPSARALRADIPPGLEAVILRCLEKDRERRYRHIGELAVALGEFAPSRARTSVDRILRTIQSAGLAGSEPAPAGSGPPQTLGVGTDAPWGRTAPATRRIPRALVLGGGAAVVAALLALALVLRGSAAAPGAGQPAADVAHAAPPAVIPPSPTPTPTPPAVAPAVSVALATETPEAKVEPTSSTSALPPAAPPQTVKAGVTRRVAPTVSKGPAKQPPATVTGAKTAPKGTVFDDR